jgi:hypothetical protein
MDVDDTFDDSLVEPCSDAETVKNCHGLPVPVVRLATYLCSAENLSSPRVYREIMMCGRQYRQYVPLNFRKFTRGRLDVEQTLGENGFIDGERDIARVLLEFESRDDTNIATLTAVFSSPAPAFKREPRKNKLFNPFY